MMSRPGRRNSVAKSNKQDIRCHIKRKIVMDGNLELRPCSCLRTDYLKQNSRNDNHVHASQCQVSHI